MEIDLKEVTVEELLKAFGAGNHKPGSGSAAAFHGMLSAKLLITVISLTNEGKYRAKYKSILPKLLEMRKDIGDSIFPRLTKLFYEDATQFGKTIEAREKRDAEKDLFKKSPLVQMALEELKKSVEIPCEIAKHCISLAEIAEFVFDNAFQSARGDSQVSLSGSVAALSGCMSIIQLNLLSFESDEYEWTSKKVEETKKIKKQYLKLSEIANKKIEILENEVEGKIKLHNEVDKLLKQIKSKPKLDNFDIEKVATDFQNLMWIHRATIWKKNNLTNPIEVLKPKEVFKKALGYRFAILDNIPTFESNNESFKIAGLIDQKNKLVLVSDNFDTNIQNFTAAHELGHALLHKQTVMHRDRALDGMAVAGKRSLQELQADKFATYFLMPSKLVMQAFQEIFGVNKFVINENNTFNLVKHSIPSKLKSECKDLRGLSLKLASTEKYIDESYISISSLFGVSVTAMARRLEELDLLEF